MTVRFSHEVTGKVNDRPISGKGEITLKKDGEFNGKVNFTEFPSSFHPYVLDSSILSLDCAVGADGQNTPNLLDITGGNYHAIRTYIIVNPNNEINGNIITTLWTKKIKEDEYDSKLDVHGFYTGPVNLKSCSDYEINMNQQSPGRIGGRHVAHFVTDNNEKYTIYCSTEFLYSNQNKSSEEVLLKISYKNTESDKNSERNFNNNVLINGFATVTSLVRS